jgi:hypothetical protein
MNSVSDLINSIKGIAGSGVTLSESIKQLDQYIRTMEPGDIVRSEPPLASAAPIAYDLWYLWCHANMMKNYHDGIDGDHFDYSSYISNNLSFLSALPGLKPVKTLRDLSKHLVGTPVKDRGFWEFREDYANNGVYWINSAVWEIVEPGRSFRYPSDGPKSFNVNDYVGYLTFPVGQLGVMEVISLLQETLMTGYTFSGGESPSEGYASRSASLPKTNEIPKVQSPPEMFPSMDSYEKDACYGRHLIEGAYLIPSEPVPSVNASNSSGLTAKALTPITDVEILASEVKTYPEDVRPKMWMRYWIHKDSVMPVPGEFIGILCKPMPAAPHVWWFQESSPILYAGNWMETRTLTSGVVASVTLEANRTDDGVGNQYSIKVQGCEITVDSTDFFSYAVGDRVAVMKIDTTAVSATTSFAWHDMVFLKSNDSKTIKSNYVIFPATFYKISH